MLRSPLRTLCPEPVRTTSAAWYKGDWNADFRFNQHDIAAARQKGNYLRGPYVDAAVAEQGA